MSKFIKVMAVVFCLITLSGCTNTTSQDYVRKQFSSWLEETQLGPNIWKVRFGGGSKWTMSRAQDHALLRCADITLQNGSKFFLIGSSGATSVDGHNFIPGTSTTTFIGNTAYTTRTGDYNSSYSKPVVSYTIEMHKQKPDIQAIVYDAQFICDSLGKKYNAQCGTF